MGVNTFSSIVEKKTIDKPEELLALFRLGDRKVTQALFYKYYPYLCQIIFRIINDKQTTEDLAQVTFIKFWEKRSEIQIQHSLKGYLRQMAIYEAIAYCRKKKFIQVPLSEEFIEKKEAGIEERLIWQEKKEKLVQAIEQLPPRCREVFKLSRFAGLPHQRIADRLNISPKTVEHHISRALRKLRNNIKEQEQEQEIWC